MREVNKNILIASGGTGGHIYPSLSLANFLKNRYKVKILTDKRGLKYLTKENKINIQTINSETFFGKNLFYKFISLIKIASSIFFSLFLIIKFKPKLVIGMGGYSSFPVCIAAYFLKKPIFIYENNLVIGRTNKFILPFAKKILVSTKDLKGVDAKYESKIFEIGYLIRDQILKLKTQNFSKDKNQIFSILIIGGSQSAKVFGEILPDIMTKFSTNDFKVKIYQQCLANQINQITEIYKKSNLEFKLFSFAEDITQYYKLSHLAITRSGASSLAELANLRIPFIAIPLPSSTDNHQFHNANYFENKGYGFLLNQSSVSDKLLKILIDLKTNNEKLFLMREKMRKHSDESNFFKVVKLIEKSINEKN